MPPTQWTAEAARLQDRLGRVGPQPLDVHSFTNKRFTANLRLPVEEVQRLLPPTNEPPFCSRPHREGANDNGARPASQASLARASCVIRIRLEP